MSKIEDGGPAFPVPTGDPAFEPSHGMSLRDWFAGQALALGGEFFHHLGNGCNTVETVTVAAYELADAMLKERSK